jgi:CheY-like chemotaxis protein
MAMDTKKKPRILIVDDEKMNLKVLADLLRDEYRPVLARDGEQALQHAFGEEPPDLILLDVIMPQTGRLRGYQATQGERPHQEHPGNLRHLAELGG